MNRIVAPSVELRHLDGVKGNFGVSDSEYIAISTSDASLTEKCLTTTIPHAVYRNELRNENYCKTNFGPHATQVIMDAIDSSKME